MKAGLCSLENTYHRIENASDYCRQRLFGGEGEGFAAFLDHLPHLADAFGALGGALMAFEDVARAGRARLDGEGDVTLAKAIAVADVHGAANSDRS